jgi:DNA-binding XRE family transcriptional regulator
MAYPGTKKKHLQRAGWTTGDTADFLDLTREESRFLDLKLALATGVRELRERRGMTQAALADRLGSSQSRVAKMEAGDRSVSLDLMMKSLLTIGATTTEIVRWIKRAETNQAA